jgi:uncharacterized protein YdcH (DUF465 family)
MTAARCTARRRSTRTDGARREFVQAGSNWSPSQNYVKDRLASISVGGVNYWMLSRRDEGMVLLFNTSGHIVRQQSIAGPSVWVTYSATTGLQNGLKDDFGRLLVALIARLQQQAQADAEELVRRDREIGRAQVKIDKLNFELARLKRWKFDARTEAMAELQRLREVEKQFKRLQEEHDLLKKAIRFASERKQKSSPSSRQTGKRTTSR